MPHLPLVPLLSRLGHFVFPVAALVGIILGASTHGLATGTGEGTTRNALAQPGPRLDLTRLKTPVLLAGNEFTAYRDPAAYYHHGTFYLSFVPTFVISC